MQDTVTKSNNSVNHTDSVNKTSIEGERHTFNLQSSRTKPYDTDNVLKTSDKKKTKWGDFYRRIFIVNKRNSGNITILFAGILGYYSIFIS